MRSQRVWDSFVAVFRKEFIHVRRDRATLFTALSIPLFQLLLFGFLDQTVRHVPTWVADQDRSTLSRDFLAKLEASGTFRIERVTDDPARVRAALVSGEARAGVVLPPDFGARRSRAIPGQPAEVLVLIDGSDSVVSSQVLAAANGLAASIDAQVASERTLRNGGAVLSVHPLVLFNPAGRTANYIIPGMVAILLQIVALVLAAVAIVRERERGTLEQLLVTPVDPLGLMLGKLAPYLLIGLLEMALILFAMRVGFDVPISGSLLFLFLAAVVYLCALLALGLLISTRAATQSQAQQQAQLFFLPAVFLSGYIFPTAGLPWPLYVLGRFIPATHMVEIMRGVVLRGAGPRELAGELFALVLLCVAAIALSTWRFRKVIA